MSTKAVISLTTGLEDPEKVTVALLVVPFLELRLTKIWAGGA